MDMDKFNECALEALTSPVAQFLVDHYIFTFNDLSRLHEGICEQNIELYFNDLHKKITELKELTQTGKPKVASD